MAAADARLARTVKVALPPSVTGVPPRMLISGIPGGVVSLSRTATESDPGEPTV